MWLVTTSIVDAGGRPSPEGTVRAKPCRTARTGTHVGNVSKPVVVPRHFGFGQLVEGFAPTSAEAIRIPLAIGTRAHQEAAGAGGEVRPTRWTGGQVESHHRPGRRRATRLLTGDRAGAARHHLAVEAIEPVKGVRGSSFQIARIRGPLLPGPAPTARHNLRRSTQRMDCR